MITEYFQASHSLRSLPGLYLDHSKTVVTVQCICTMQHTQWKVYSTKGARYFLRSVCQLSPPTKGLYKIRTGLWILCACVRERGRAREGTLPKEATGGHAVFTSTNKHSVSSQLFKLNFGPIAIFIEKWRYADKNARVCMCTTVNSWSVCVVISQNL